MIRGQMQSVIAWLALALFALVSVACGSEEQSQSSHKPVPGPVSATPLCVISADCPAGQHCDLGECIQDCNTQDPCTGQKTCSPRARCLAAGAKDEDPPPVTVQAGTVSADPTTALLTEADTSLTVTLKSTSSASVHYRVQLNAPHLSIDKVRGDFTGSTTLKFVVASSALKGRDVPGSIKIWTNLGNVVVDAPIHVGLTGKYHGALRYDSGLVGLGDARVAVELIENNGDVSLLMDPKSSLLFPASSAGPATGFGLYVAGQPIELNISQRIDATLGGTRNHFERDLGRKLKLTLNAATGGNLDGTFEDAIYGLFEQPLTVTGSVHLQYDPNAGDPAFTLTALPTMPPAPSGLYDPVVLRWTGQPTCAALLASLCGTTWNSSTTTALGCYSALEGSYYKPLADTVAGVGTLAGVDYSAISAACTKTLAADSLITTSVSPQDLQYCGLTAPIACSLREAADPALQTSSDIAMAAGRLVGETAAPALLVAQEQLVQALSDSLLPGGTLKELGRYDTALTALGPIATWLLQPGVLQYLKAMSAAEAQGPLSTTSETQDDTYPSARALAKVFTILSAIDGERTRLGALLRGSDQDTLVKDAQERALLSFLEAATLIGVVDGWAVTPAPDNVVAQFTGVLTPLDSGFGALLQGANGFGIPDGFVPFVFNPANTTKGNTNFEQMLADANVVVTSYAQLEDTYQTDARSFEANQDAIRRELLQVGTSYDTRLSDLCGAAFDPSSIKSDTDWANCTGGEVGLQLLAIDEASARLQSSESRIAGMKDKISIDKSALAQSQQVHEDTLQFIDENGNKIEAVTMAEGIIDAEQAVIQTASQASIVNLGAPAGEAIVTGILGLAKAGLETRRAELQTAQTMRFEQANAQTELINGMANIQKETIDLAQLGVDMQQDVISVHEARLRAFNTVDQARRLFDDRTRALSIASLSPAHDPSFRLIRNSLALSMLGARARAQRQLYLAARALEYDINSPIPAVSGAVLNARNKLNMQQLGSCLTEVFNGYHQAYGTPQKYVTEVSVRKQLGINAERTDEVTGQKLSQGDQFRMLVLRNENLDGKGGVGVTFATDLQPGNGLWSTDVCADRITGVRAQLVGDFLGDATAKVHVLLSGGAILRDCGSDSVQSWEFGSVQGDDTVFAAIQAGVNNYGSAPVNSSLFGQSVARASWQIVIPGGETAPENADVDLKHLEDVVLEISHEALPQHSSPLGVDLSCLASIQ